MKKNFKKVFFLLLLVSFILFPKSALAETISSNIKSINESLNLDIDNVKLNNVIFKDYSGETSRNFGLHGLVTNTNNYNITLNTRVYYYDKDQKEIVFFDVKKNIPSNMTVDYNVMSNLDILSFNYLTSDIKYYKISINITKEVLKDDIKPSEQDSFDDYPYVIDKYDVNIVINEDNTYDITESIDAYFKVDKHGINRFIPLKSEMARVDGTKNTKWTRISNIKVNDNFKKSISNGLLNLKIGSPDKTYNGLKNYVISYKHIHGSDTNKGYDEFYYNIIGNKWDTVIGNVTFKITLPKSFDSSKLGFSYGNYGSTQSDRVEYIVNDNVIIGKYHGFLLVNDALTFRLTLDDNYFKASSIIDSSTYYLLILPIIFALFGYYLWNKYGRDEEVIETVEFYPPDNKNSLDLAYLYKGNATKKDVISLLFYLANKGYLEIKEIPEKKVFRETKTYKFIKLKEYDGNNVCERMFLNGLFSKSNTKKYSINNIIDAFSDNDDAISDKNEVFVDDLKEKFYNTINKIIVKANGTGNHNSIYEKVSIKKALIGILYVISIIIMGISFYINGRLESYIGIFILTIIFFVIAYCLLPFNTRKKHKYIASYILFIVPSIISFLMFLNAFRGEMIFIIMYLLWNISIIALLVEMKFITKRNKYGIEVLGKIRGFRNFLETAEKDKLEALVEENPTYFYDILPYTYSLNISDKWVKNFEDISMEPPTWYVGTYPFNIINFTSSINECMAESTSAMTSMPSTDSSSGSGGGFGGSSGGGFSGGGSGGGGGSSW